MESVIKIILNFTGKLFPKQHPPGWPIKRIGVIIWGGLGDSLLFYPALKSIRKYFENTEIGIFPQRASAGIFLEGLYDKVYYCIKDKDRKIDFILPLLRSLRHFKPDMIISNAANPEFLSSLLSYLSGAKYRIGYSHSGRGFFFNIPVEDFQSHEIDKNLKLVSFIGIPIGNKNIEIPVIPVPFEKKGKTIGFHPGSGKGMKFKRWDKEKFLKLGKMILNAGYYLVLLGSREEGEEIEFLKRNLGFYPHFIDRSNLDDIRKTAYIVSQLDMLVSNDTIIAHIASALDIPLIVIFGPSDENRYGPFGNRGYIIKEDILCRPCSPEIARKCENRVCLQRIMPEEAFSRVMEIMEKLKKNVKK